MKLVALLPYLALAGFAIEPVAAHGPRSRHAQVVRSVNKPVARSAAGAQLRPGHIMRRDGQGGCRPRPQAAVTTDDSAATSDDSATTSDDSATTSDDSTTTTDDSAATTDDSAATTDAPAADDSAATTNAPAADDSAATTTDAPAADATTTDAPAADDSAATTTDAAADATTTDAAGPSADNNLAEPTSTATEATTDAATSTSSQAPASTYVPQGGGSTENFGLLWPNNQWGVDTTQQDFSSVSWTYGWTSKHEAISAFHARGWTNMEFVPMIWGVYREAEQLSEDKDQMALWYREKDQWPSNTKHALFVNEPEIADQAGISPSDAYYKLWTGYKQTCEEKGMACGSAAITSLDLGIKWLQEFEQFPNAKADFMALHWYGKGTPGGDSAFTKFKTHVETFRAAFPDRDIWLTEYACHDHGDLGPCDHDETWAFHTEAVAWMKSTSYIKRYAPFMASPTGLQNGVSTDNNICLTAYDPSDSNWLKYSALGNWYAY